MDPLLDPITDKLVELNFSMTPGCDEEMGDEDRRMSDWSLHACAYCGIHDPAAVVQCLQTRKWFCNGRGNTSGNVLSHHGYTVALVNRNVAVKVRFQSKRELTSQNAF